VQLDVRNRTGYNINVRSGPGTDFDEAGVFRYDATYTVDGRNADGSWIRLIRDDGFAWVRADLTVPVDDIPVMSLPVVTGSDAAPMGQQITVVAESDCGGGLFLLAEGAPQSLTVNDIPLVVEGALLTIIEDQELVFFALSGNPLVNATALEPGMVVVEPQPDEGASVHYFPVFDLVDALPVEPEVCLVSSEGVPAIYPQPDPTTEAADEITGGHSFPVDGYTMRDDVKWWRLMADAGWITADATVATAFCESVAEIGATRAETQPATNPSGASGLMPEEVILRYLNARVAGDAGQMQQLACAAWRSQAAIQAQSFRAMRAELRNVSCTTIEMGTTVAMVQCTGYIETEYNGVFRQWPLGLYRASFEGGAWRMCGEG